MHIRIGSSTYGEIEVVLLLYWQFLQPCKKPTHNSLKKAAKAYYDPLMKAIARGRKLQFLIVIECDADTNIPRFGRNVRFEDGQPGKLRAEKEIRRSGILKGKMASFAEYSGEEGTDSSSGDDKYEVQYIFTNIDFQRLAAETLHAYDLNSEILKLEDFSDLYNWIQDPFLAMTATTTTHESERVPYGNLRNTQKTTSKVVENREIIILEPFYSWPTTRGNRTAYNFKYLPEVISSQSDVLLRSFPFYIQGGNILTGGNYALMGNEIMKVNLEMLE